ncbi:MAG: TIGR03862 family flavoprotein [Beijerinckiaceae bacterium]|nr:TIGR03862 family flavoprotein [Beijerinckiaceae bacterium]
MSAPSSVAIIGAGPAGLMAAERLSAAGIGVTVHDRMASPARKFLLAGRGGLNLTHSEPPERFVRRYREAEGRLRPVMEAFSALDLQRWCASLGEPTFTGSSGRVFPKSFKASPLLRAWLRRLSAQGVVFRMRHRWIGWAADGAPRFETAQGETMSVTADATLLALGGASWPRLGSDGAWASTLREAGIEVRRLRPANGGFSVAWSAGFNERFKGAPLKRIALSLDGETARGEAVITDGGIEGGAVYALSALIRDRLDASGPLRVSIDLRPDLSQSELEGRLSGARGGDSLSNQLRKRGGLSPAAIGLMRESVGGTLPQDAASLARLAKSATIEMTAARPIDRAISTAGGVSFAELDDRLMLRARPGVFAAGEMLDWEAPTGGYLLQACFSTGVAAANGILAWLDRREDKPSQ